MRGFENKESEPDPTPNELVWSDSEKKLTLNEDFKYYYSIRTSQKKREMLLTEASGVACHQIDTDQKRTHTKM